MCIRDRGCAWPLSPVQVMHTGCGAWPLTSPGHAHRLCRMTSLTSPGHAHWHGCWPLCASCGELEALWLYTLVLFSTWAVITVITGFFLLLWTQNQWKLNKKQTKIVLLGKKADGYLMKNSMQFVLIFLFCLMTVWNGLVGLAVFYVVAGFLFALQIQTPKRESTWSVLGPPSRCGKHFNIAIFFPTVIVISTWLCTVILLT